MSTTAADLSVLLVSDRRFIKGGDGYWYTEGPRGAETGERYLQWFGSVTVAGRAGTMDGLRAERLNRLNTNGQQIVTLPNLSVISSRINNLHRARLMLRGLIERHDAVIARMGTALGLEAIFSALSLRKLFAVDLGGCTWDAMRSSGKWGPRIFAPIAFQRVRSAVSQTYWVSYVTQEYLQRRYPAAAGAKTISCSNVDLPPAVEDTLRKRLARQAQGQYPLVFGTIGSLHTKYKGLQHALEALGAAKMRLPSFRYRVLGGGDPEPWRALVNQHGLSENVVFDGTLPAGQPVREWLDQIDVYLQPSLTEGVPRALIEAMSRGCPAVASNVGGLPELLPADVLHGAGDVKRLTALIEAAITPAFMSAHAVRNWERAKDFTSERLDALRDQFWGAFAEEARARKGG